MQTVMLRIIFAHKTPEPERQQTAHDLRWKDLVVKISFQTFSSLFDDNITRPI